MLSSDCLRLVALFGYPLRRAVPLNLAVSFVAVIVAAAVRWGLAKQPPMPSTLLVVFLMMTGGMLGAAVGVRWLASFSDERLHTAVRTLLVFIGVLLIIEAAPPGLRVGFRLVPWGREWSRSALGCSLARSAPFSAWPAAS